jgi:hypothetical protein
LFCTEEETTTHLFVNRPFVNCLRQWLVLHNNFNFSCHTLEDLWLLDACISLKNQILVEMIKDVLWNAWLERNRICSQNDTPHIVQEL